ncbi:MAG TPA: hypothetical protein VIK28_05780, partial [Sedimentisphaerales bacterium]
MGKAIVQIVTLKNERRTALAVRKSEFANKTRTTSPRLVFIVDGGFGTIPIFGKSIQTRTQI